MVWIRSVNLNWIEMFLTIKLNCLKYNWLFVWIIDSLLIAVHAFVNLVSMSFSVDSTLLPRYVNLSTSLSGVPSDLTDKMKRSFFQAAVTSILLYGCTTWTLTKRLEKKLDGNYTRMLRAILNKSLAATPHKTPTVRPPAPYHDNYSS